ncbi:MAG: hypothetical protein M3680_08640 [Myxococcota bacterium]|nr:hypothetical protein [Myxococcota bacterium]
MPEQMIHKKGEQRMPPQRVAPEVPRPPGKQDDLEPQPVQRDAEREPEAEKVHRDGRVRPAPVYREVVRPYSDG